MSGPTTSDRVTRRFDPRTYLAALAVLSVVVLVVDRPPVLALLFVASIGAALAAGGPRRAGMILLMALAVMWGTMLSQGLFYRAVPRTPLIVLLPSMSRDPLQPGGIVIWKEGLLHGAVQALRFITMTVFGLSLCWLLSGRDLLLAFRRLRMPYPLAFMTVAALRFLPAIAEEGRNSIRAQRLRGGRFPWLRPLGWPEAVQRWTRPVIVRAIRAAGTLALAVQSRAFDPTGPRSAFRDLRFTWRDRVVLVVMGAALAALLAVKVATWLYLRGWAAHPALLSVYAFARRWL